MSGLSELVAIVIAIVCVAWASYPFRRRKEDRLSPTWKPGGRDGR